MYISRHIYVYIYIQGQGALRAVEVARAGGGTLKPLRSVEPPRSGQAHGTAQHIGQRSENKRRDVLKAHGAVLFVSFPMLSWGAGLFR